MQPDHVIKRSGASQSFDPSKIRRSLSQAIVSAGLKDNPLSDKLSRQVISYLEENMPAENKITSDDIRSAVNIILLDNDLPEVAKIYFKTRGKKMDKQQRIFPGIKKIKKRDGSVVDFDKNKVYNAAYKSGQASGEFGEEEARKLADIITSVVEHKFSENQTPTVEEIQDIIEIILIQSNWARTAKAFILYREQRKKMRLEQGKVVTSEEVKSLQERGVTLSKQAKLILNNSTNFDELGRIIFLDRYSIKDKREDIAVGDLVIVITKEDRNIPKKTWVLSSKC